MSPRPYFVKYIIRVDKIIREHCAVDDIDLLQEVIEKALLAERERAANIVFQQFAPDQGYDMDPAAIEAIRAIRS